MATSTCVLKDDTNDSLEAKLIVNKMALQPCNVSHSMNDCFNWTPSVEQCLRGLQSGRGGQ